MLCFHCVPKPSGVQLNEIQLVALHTYDSANPEDLTFQEGDTITFLSRGDKRARRITTLRLLNFCQVCSVTIIRLTCDCFLSPSPQLIGTGWRDGLMETLVFFPRRLWMTQRSAASDVYDYQ